MDPNWATLDTVGGTSVLRFERHLAHPPQRVWSLVSDPAELAHWFPAAVTYATEPRPGVGVRFRFEGQDTDTTGEILEYEPPKLFSLRWQDDVLRFELVPDGDGCRLLFTHVISDSMGGALAAGRNAAGWDTCLEALAAYLDGRDLKPLEEMFQRIAAYLERYGLDRGDVAETGEGFLVRFQRDLVWRPLEQVWGMLAGSQRPTLGGPPPHGFTNRHVVPGEVTEIDPPRILEYAWRHQGVPVGRVRWEFTVDPKLGHRVVLTQTLPAAHARLRADVLAAWHARLEQCFAQLGGATGSAEPNRSAEPNESAERTDRFRAMYQARLP
ncbi:MAG TPA: SRPBCC family protein [Micromonosporaceae bacterium]